MKPTHKSAEPLGRLRWVPLAKWYGTGSGSDLALCRKRLPSPPGRYRSLYRPVLRIRQRYSATALQSCRHLNRLIVSDFVAQASPKEVLNESDSARRNNVIVSCRAESLSR